MILVIVICLLWWIVGITGGIFSWTKKFDLTYGDLLFFLILGIGGPFNWIEASKDLDFWDKIIFPKKQSS